MKTRPVLYLTDSGELHGKHRIQFGFRKAGQGVTKTADGGVALPEGAEIEVLYCMDCEEQLQKGDDFTVQERFLFEIQEWEDEPWKG